MVSGFFVCRAFRSADYAIQNKLPILVVSMSGILYLVATPIGNLGDISFRAIDVLKQVDLIACEDTRHSAKLLNHFEIDKKLVSYHAHNEKERSEEIVKWLVDGRTVAVISDAGTPAINDPGHILVKAAIEAGVRVVPIPGASAFLNAVIVSGLPTDSIFYDGFLPARKNERRKRLEEVSAIPATLVFYETPHRIAAAIDDCLDILGDRNAAVVRELTKLHEEIIRGNLTSIKNHIFSANPRGEFVLIIDRMDDNAPPVVSRETALIERIAELETEGKERKAALKQAAREFGVSRSEAYRMLQSGLA